MRSRVRHLLRRVFVFASASEREQGASRYRTTPDRAVLALALGSCAPLSIACHAGDSTAPTSSPSPLLGQPAPAIDGRALDGNALDSAALRGKPIVVEFFAEYCAPCRESLPAVVRVHARQQGDVAFIGISLDEYASAAQSMATTYGLAFPVIHDSGKLRGRFRVNMLPATFVIDAQGNVAWAHVGASSDLEKDLQSVLRSLKS